MKLYRIIGHSFFLILLLLAGLFYVERVLFADSSFQLFKMICFHEFNIEANRYSMVVAQLIQFIPIKLGFSLNSIVLTYSLAFIIIFYISYLICIYVLKNDIAGIIILLIIIGIRCTFFHAISEIWQAMTFTTIFFAWLQFYNLDSISNFKKLLFFYFVCVFLIVLSNFMHPASALPILFIITFNIIHSKNYFNYKYYIPAAFVFLFAIIKYFTIPSDSYEGSFLVD